MKQRLDAAMVQRQLVSTRSAASSWIRLGRVRVDGRVATKSGLMVADDSQIDLEAPQRYVSRAGLKLASVASALALDFRDKTVLDVGSSTGGFTDFALQCGAHKVIAVDVGTDQLHPSLRGDQRIELYERTDIRDIYTQSRELRTVSRESNNSVYIEVPDTVMIDVSFISIREVLSHLAAILPASAHLPSSSIQIVAMVKPQFEAERRQLTKDGIVKNDRLRRDILADFEQWSRQSFVIVGKADSQVAGAHGNRERFYLLRLLSKK